MNNSAIYASIHGRFQPFHNAHLAYAKAALRHADRIYVGLTRVLTENSVGSAVAPHRFEDAENPLTYFQRTELIKAALLAAGISSDRFEIGPFPIEVPKRLAEFWPTYLPCFTTVVNDWNTKKIELLRTNGFDVKVLYDLMLDGIPNTDGTSIRELYRAKSERWKSYVPEAVADFIERNKITL